MRLQICASRPSAVTKKSGARSARKRRWESSAKAAASNAGPRLAEVAGSARRSERSNDAGREGIGYGTTPGSRSDLKYLKMKALAGCGPIRNSLQSALTLNCVLYTSFEGTATNFSGIMHLTNPSQFRNIG